MIANYSRVKLLTNDYATEGAVAGNIGYIIEVYDDAYEVEFSDANGITFAQIVARPEAIRLDEQERDQPSSLNGAVVQAHPLPHSLPS